MSHALFAAGRASCSLRRASRRRSSAVSLAARRPRMPTIASVTPTPRTARRRSRASQTAPRTRASVRSGSTQASVFRSWNTFWAVSSSSERRITMRPASAGSLSCDLLADADAVGGLEHDLPEVERDHATLGRDARRRLPRGPARASCGTARSPASRASGAPAARAPGRRSVRAPAAALPRSGRRATCTSLGRRSSISASTSTFAKSSSTDRCATALRISGSSISCVDRVGEDGSC